MRRLAVVIAIASLTGPSPSSAAPPDGKAEFLRWANEIARGKKLLVCRAGQLKYPGEEPGYFAALGDPKLDVPLLSSSDQHHRLSADECDVLLVPQPPRGQVLSADAQRVDLLPWRRHAAADPVVRRADSVMVHITTGPDGALCFTEELGNRIG
jgi:hypothetical protein